MRATMSLPLIFPPVELDGQVLIDGGTMNNVPGRRREERWAPTA
jgi:NTE family protein